MGDGVVSLYRDATQALDLLWHAARIDPVLKDAVEAVIKERDKLLEWATHSCEQCCDCNFCLQCGGLGVLCEFHADFDKDGCDCELEIESAD